MIQQSIFCIVPNNCDPPYGVANIIWFPNYKNQQSTRTSKGEEVTSQMEGEVEELKNKLQTLPMNTLRTLNGKHGDKELSIKDFTDNAKSAITLRGLPLSDQANFILSY